MNAKAEKFNEIVKKMPENIFNIEELENEEHTVLYRSNMEIQGQTLPLVVILDDSIYGLVRVWVAAKIVNEENRPRITAHLNELNRQYKVFKYYENEEGDIVLDTCLPSAAPFFDPEIVPAIIDVILRHLTDSYGKLMSVVWSGEKSEEN